MNSTQTTESQHDDYPDHQQAVNCVVCHWWFKSYFSVYYRPLAANFGSFNIITNMSDVQLADNLQMAKASADTDLINYYAI